MSPGTRPAALYAATIFTSAFLLFLVQPLIAKQILPWFGGTSAVWTTCLVFFQVALLAGYAYSDWTTRRLRPRVQAGIHVALLAASLVALPILASAAWKPSGHEDPTWRILGLLCATIGLPYFLLSTTGPLVQAWFARAVPGRSVYRLFALSNLASLLALICYPFAIEPWITAASQAYLWSAGYAIFAVLCAATGVSSLRSDQRRSSTRSVADAEATFQPDGESTARESDGVAQAQASPAPDAAAVETPNPGWRQAALWLAFPTMSTWLLLAVTNHITQNIASVPFLWLLPLTLYLATFIICFDHERWYRRPIVMIPMLGLLVACAYGLQSDDITLDIDIAVPLYALGLFAACMFCHGELARLKPAPRHLTRYYLMISMGGALGGVLIGVVAPRVLPSYYELGVGLTLTALLAAVMLVRLIAHKLLFVVPAGALAVVVACGSYTYRQIDKERKDVRVAERNFYGALHTYDTGPAENDDSLRRLIHGVILHGEQYLNEARHREPTSYYGEMSGVAIALKVADSSGRRVGIIGLGAGTIAAYGRPGDTFRFYDINPQVMDLARREFTFLRDSKAAIETVLGDARLNLEHESSQQFDVLVIDAFSSDSIPVHLLTREAMAVYLRHMKRDGLIVFHVTNRFLRLAPVVKQISGLYGLATALIVDDVTEGDLSSSDWLLVSRSRDAIGNEAIRDRASEVDEISGLRPWTDDYNNLFQILKR